MTSADLKTSLHLFGLGERAAIVEIKARHQRRMWRQFKTDPLWGERQGRA
ncbi:hypothetical protein [Oryzomonas sagensis]|nr:hypothetical protein [Oryzomonas sagensis]